MIAQGFRFRFPMSLSVKPIPIGGLICSDSFTRADGAAGSAPVGGYPWSGASTIVGNELVITPTAGANLITNGTFAIDANWSKVNGATISANVAHLANNQAITQVLAGYVAGVGQWLSLSYNIPATNDGVLKLPNFAHRDTFLNYDLTLETVVGIYRYVLRSCDSGGDGIEFVSNSFIGTIDDVALYLLTASTLFASNGPYPWQDVDARVDATLTAGTQAGLWIAGDAANPSNAVLAYHDGTRVRLTQIVAGVYTNKISVVAAYAAGATIRLVKSDTTYTLYYNGTVVGATTITGMTGRYCGTFSTSADNTFTDWEVYRTPDPFVVPVDVPQSEVDALIYLFETTNGGSWTTNTNWLTSTTVGTWHGITVVGGHVTQVNLNGNNVIGTVNGSTFFAGLPSLTHLYLYANATLAFNCALSDLPASMAWLDLYNTDSVITGALSDLPATMTDLYLYNTDSVITGALSDLPATLVYLYLSNTDSVITGGGVAIAATGINDIRLENCALTNGQTNSIVDRIYADRALFTAAAPKLNIGGTNTDPSGIFQSACPPTTQLEELWELKNDDCAEGTFNLWTVTY